MPSRIGMQRAGCAEDEIIEVGLEVLAAQPMIDAQAPDLEVGEAPDSGRTMWAAILPTTWESGG
jgi:hypothetical protein